MADSKPDFFVSAETETETEVDETTAGAIQRGIQAADDGLVVSSEEVRELARLWILSTPTPR